MNDFDESKFNTIFTDNYQRIFRYLYSKMDDPIEAQDLTQAVFLALFENWNDLQFFSEKRTINWLFSVAKNQLSNFYRKKKRSANLLPLEEMEYEEALFVIQDFEENIISNDRQETDEELLQMVAEMLNKKDRQLFELVYLRKMPYEQIVTQLGISNNALRSKICRMKIKVKEIVHALFQ